MSQLVPTNSSPVWNTWENDLMSTMYTDTYWHTNDFKTNSYKMGTPDYSQLDVLNCQPSRTTPTLTSVPATMRSQEQTFLEDYHTDAEPHQNQAGFVPPLVSSASVPVSSAASTIHDSKYFEGIGNRILTHVDLKTWNGGTTTVSDVPSLVHLNSSSLSPPIPTTVLAMGSDSSNSSSGSPLSSSSGRRNIGGRRPKNEKGISPEEDERRKQRRERNKLAAARCRKRRLDHTNELVEETQDLESKKQRLREEVEKLKQEKQELQYILDSHIQQSQCRVRDTDSPPDIKPFVLDPSLATQINSMVANGTHINPAVTSCEDTKLFNQMAIPVSSADKLTSMSAPRPRPNSLPVSNTFLPKNRNNMGFADIAGISITTPSTGLMNFDSLIEGGTGLTPLTSSLIPSCSTQQRNFNVVDLSSPDSNPNKLVSL